MGKLLTRRTYRPLAYAALSLVIFWPLVVKADMVPSNILQRVFNLRMGSATGTGFTIEVDNRQYLITAKHVIGSSAPSGTIEIFHNNNWVSGTYRLIEVEPEAVDIAVLTLDQQLGAVLPVMLGGMKGAFLSQTVFFVGFPYGLSIEGGAANSGYPLPLVKHGIIAAFLSQEGRPFIIDGINNPGFSGGPVVIAQNPQNPDIIGVVSAYQAAVEPVFQQGQQHPDLSVRTNTGLLIGFDLDYAVKAIQKNPIGYLLR
jgi:S1-C subfamily serine protease